VASPERNRRHCGQVTLTGSIVVPGGGFDDDQHTARFATREKKCRTSSRRTVEASSVLGDACWLMVDVEL
jgi:hypothetical protein